MSDDEAPLTPRSTSRPPSREEALAADNQLTLAVRQIVEANRALNAPDGMLAGLRGDVASIAKQNEARAVKEDKNWQNIKHEVSRVSNAVGRIESAQQELQTELRRSVGELRQQVADLKIRTEQLESEVEKLRSLVNANPTAAAEAPEATKVTKRQR